MLNFFFQKFWKNELHTADKDSIRNRTLRSYKLFKDVKVEPFTICQILFSLKKALSKFRRSDYDLHIKTGRYKCLQGEERLCTMRPSDCIEDGIPFLSQSAQHIRNLEHPSKDLPTYSSSVLISSLSSLWKIRASH